MKWPLIPAMHADRNPFHTPNSLASMAQENSVHAVPLFAVRLNGGRNPFEGRVEIESEEGRWLPVCGDGFDLRTGTIVCKHLNYGWAYHAFATVTPLDEGLTFNWTGLNDPIFRLECGGRESLLSECRRSRITVRSCSPKQENWASVICTHCEHMLFFPLFSHRWHFVHHL